MTTLDPLRFDTLQPGFRSDPYMRYRQMQERFPIFWSEVENAWVLTRYADIAAALADRRLLTCELGQILRKLAGALGKDLTELSSLADAVLFLRNPPAHPLERKFLGRILMLFPLSAFEPVIASATQRFLEPLRRDGRMDLVTDYADCIPPAVMGSLFGLGEQESLFLANLLNGVTSVFDRAQPMRVYQELNQKVVRAYAFLSEEFARRRRSPGNDALSRMIGLNDTEYRLENERLISTAAFLFMAGVDTTAALIGNGLRLLLEHPAESQRLVADPSLLESAVEEIVRLDPPAQQTSRYASEDCCIAEQAIQAGQRLLLLIAAANRDPAIYPEPDCLQFDRQGPPNLSFGKGQHACLGAGIAKLEAKMAYAEILKWPRLQMERKPLEWWPNQNQRRLKSLPVILV